MDWNVLLSHPRGTIGRAVKRLIPVHLYMCKLTNVYPISYGMEVTRAFGSAGVPGRGQERRDAVPALAVCARTFADAGPE